jgi:hypothetical protein
MAGEWDLVLARPRAAAKVLDALPRRVSLAEGSERIRSLRAQNFLDVPPDARIESISASFSCPRGICDPLGRLQGRFAVAPNLFPFPCVLDFGLLSLEIGRNCLVLARKDRYFPHVTLFYEPKPSGKGKGHYWPHVTKRDKCGNIRHIELARWKPDSAKHVEQQFRSQILPRFQSIVRPTSIEQLADENWILIAPTMAIVEVFVNAMLEGRKFIFERLGSLVGNPGAGPFWEALFDSMVEPTSLRHAACPDPYVAIRFDDEGNILDRGMLNRFKWGGAPSWYLVPMDLECLTPDEMVRTMFPAVFEFMDKVSEVLELPLPIRAPEIILG